MLPLFKFDDLPGDKSDLESKIAAYHRTVERARELKAKFDGLGSDADASKVAKAGAEVAAIPVLIRGAAYDVATAALDFLVSARDTLRAEAVELAALLEADAATVAPLNKAWRKAQEEARQIERLTAIPAHLTGEAYERQIAALPGYRAAHQSKVEECAAIAMQITALERESTPRRNRSERVRGYIEACNGRAMLVFRASLDERHDWPARARYWAERVATDEAQKIVGAYGQRFF